MPAIPEWFFSRYSQLFSKCQLLIGFLTHKSQKYLTSLQFNRVFTTDIRKHISVVFAGGIIGFLSGVVLNALPATVHLRYIGALCLCGASWFSAIGTWLLSDFCDDAPLGELDNLEDLTNWRAYSQRLIGQKAAQSTLTTGNSDDIPEMLRKVEGLKITHKDSTAISTAIDRSLIKASPDLIPVVTEALSKGEEILPKTRELWEAGYSEIIVVRRETFARFGVDNRFAIGVLEDGRLKVFVGMPALQGQGNDFAVAEEGSSIEM